VQVHGVVDIETLQNVFDHAGARRIIKVIHVTGRDAIEAAERCWPYCHALQMDSRTADRLGGSGMTHDWDISGRSLNARLYAVFRAFSRVG
jgi:phosphoribosylanthranilate isomerase